MLFDENFPTDISSEEELDVLIKKYSHLDRAYIVTGCVPERKKKIEQLWSFYKDFCPDNNFLSQLKKASNFHSRTWEMYLAYVLYQQGFNLKKHPEHGPDIKIKLDNGKTLWIEAIAIDLGKIDPVESLPKMESGVMYSFDGKVDEIQRPRLIRLSHAFILKHKKYIGYIKDGIVKPDDYLFIAINNSEISHHAYTPSLLQGLVYGKGLDTYIKIPGESKLKRSFQIRDFIEKINAQGKKVPVETNFFITEKYKEITGIIMCDNHAINGPLGKEAGSTFHFAYNLQATLIPPKPIYSFGTTYLGEQTIDTRSMFVQDSSKLVNLKI